MGKPKREWVKKSELARRLGRAQSAVSQLILQGVVKPRKDGLVDYQASVDAIAASRDPNRDQQRKPLPGSENGKPAKDTGYAAAKALREKYQAELSRLEYEKKSGKLVDADEVREASFTAARTMRDAMLNVPDRIAPLVAAEKDGHRCHAIILNEVRLALDSLKLLLEKGINVTNGNE